MYDHRISNMRKVRSIFLLSSVVLQLPALEA